MKQIFKNLNLDDLKSQIDIVSLIEEYSIDLETSGDNYIALCPFHPDNKTKSFFVCPATNTWYCFGCKRGSSVFDFIMEIEHKSFWEAVQFLAEKIGYVEIFSLDALQKRLGRLQSEEENVGLNKFRKAHNYIEGQIYIKVKENFNTAKDTLVPQEYETYIKKLKDLWRWYDKGQQWFDLYIYRYKTGENIDLAFLIKKLQSFYSKFLEKFERLSFV